MAIDTLKSATRDGVTLRYTDTGTGDRALVFVHGWTCEKGNWRYQIPHFSARHRCIALDQRGHGASDKPDQDYTVDGFVDDLAWFIRDLRLDRPVLIGHSMGGTVSFNLIRRQPEIARGLVMVDSLQVPIPSDMRPMTEGLIAGLQSPAYKTVAEGFARTGFFNESSPQRLVEELVPCIADAPQRLMHTAIASLLDEKVMQPGAPPVPTLFLRASTQFASEEELRERYPGIDVHTLEAAHFVQLEKPDETNTLIDRFLEKLT
jgi:pimeloyl-ACP methyl ester carboxylesterase